MNLTHLKLDSYGLPENAEMQITVFLIACELQCRKLMKALTSIGCDACFCVPDLSDVVLALSGFTDCPDELYEYYSDLLDKHCGKVSRQNNLCIKEAVDIYYQLKDKNN